MQFSQPNFQPPIFNQCGQPTGFHAPIPTPTAPYFNGYPDLIGEGNVITVTLPDGSTQHVFLPTIQWPQYRPFYIPSPSHPYFGNPYVNHAGGWLVRSICNQLPPTTFCQPLHQECHGLQFTRTPALDCCVNLPPPVTMSHSGFPVKFHNDGCTSTSDLHFFIPKQWNWYRTPCGSVGVQQVPIVANAGCNYETAETKHCNCPEKKTSTTKVVCECDKESNNSRMSIDSTKSKRKWHKQKSNKTNSKSRWSSGSDMSIDSYKSSHRCKTKSRKEKICKPKKSHHTCECREPQADKSVVTYADQGNYCAPDTGRETQTASNSKRVECECYPVAKKCQDACKPKPIKPGCSKKVCKSLSWESMKSHRRKNVSASSCTSTSGSELTDY